MIITELVNNSLKHGQIDSKSLEIDLVVSKENGVLLIQYRDNGQGYGEHLNSLRNGHTFGIAIIEGLADQLDGTLELYDENGACARLMITVDEHMELAEMLD